MKDYVGKFVKLKLENDGTKTAEECERINEYHKSLGFDFEVKPEDCRKNPGFRMVSKICLNSLWGKFCQNPTLDNYEFITNYESFLKKVLDPKIETKSFDIINDNCIEHRFVESREHQIEPEHISEITAIFTTANARLRLYDLISWLDPTQLIYCDTDSV